jgi:glutaredoxin-like protein NrdH
LTRAARTCDPGADAYIRKQFFAVLHPREKTPVVSPGRHVDALSIERRFKMENKVKMYTLSTCSHCKATKRFLDECSIKYEFTDVDTLEGEERNAILEDVRKFNPRCSFPTIIIGDRVIVGFKENEIKEALGL